jgi:hypothetical protein
MRIHITQAQNLSNVVLYSRSGFFGDMKVAVRYVIGEKASHNPNLRMIGGRVSFQDYIDVMSLIDGGKATHGLVALLWAAESTSLLGSGLHRTLREFGNTITTADISDEFDKIVAIAEASDTLFRCLKTM